MISGRDALARIEGAISKARANEGALDAALRSAEAEAARLRAERLGLLRDLARVRLDAFQQEGLVGALDMTERRALDLVKDRTTALKAQASERQALFKSVQHGEEERHGKAASLEKALSALESVKKAAEPKIRASTAWKAQEDRIAAALKVVEEAEKKTVQAENDREEKRKPYEDDPLFMYLWKAKFGTADYKGGTVARFFDRMIAKKVGWPDARANYAMLNEIPLRLREHAERCKANVERERANLAKAEADALRELGAGDLVGKVDAARDALIAAEKALSTAKEALAAFESRTAAATADPAYEKAIELLAEADGRQDIQDLYAEAARTQTREDERIVRQIELTEKKLAEAEEEIGNIRFQVRDLARRRADIERERDHFRQRGYDNPYGTFGNESAIGQVLGGLLEGALKGAILRDTLRDGYRQRDNSWGNGGSVFGPWTVPDNSSSAPSGGGQWVPPWLDGGSSSGGGSWGGDSGGGSSGGGDGFSTGGGV